MAKLSLPSTKEIGNTAATYGWGAGTGLVYQLLSRIFGGGVVPSAITAVVAGGMVKGEHTKPIMAVLGFELGRTLNIGSFGNLGGIFGGTNTPTTSEDEI
jgi:hypothetical protein